jgi:hydrogenase/urease accessory protein HupE
MPVGDGIAPRARAGVARAIAVACVLFCGDASAHAVGLSRGEYVVGDRSVTVDVTLARGDAETFASAEALARALHVSMGGAVCPSGEARFTEAPPDGLTMHARYDCPGSAETVLVDAAFVTELAFGHRHLVHASSDTAAALDDVLLRGHQAFAFATGASAPPRASLARAGSMVRMGVEHILTGYDHLLFLLGLVLACRSVRVLLGAVTAFTAAHSITLAVSTLGLWAPPPSLVEPLIAASIAYVGLENLIAPSARGRWRLTFPFGLVHGFGFAGALREVHFARESLPVVLGAFNVGVELGQLAVLTAMVPVVLAMRRRSWFRRRGRIALNGAVAVTGFAWTVLRVFGGTT